MLSTSVEAELSLPESPGCENPEGKKCAPFIPHPHSIVRDPPGAKQTPSACLSESGGREDI